MYICQPFCLRNECTWNYGRFLLQVTGQCFTNTESIPNTCNNFNNSCCLQANTLTRMKKKEYQSYLVKNPYLSICSCSGNPMTIVMKEDSLLLCQKTELQLLFSFFLLEVALYRIFISGMHVIGCMLNCDK